ncbi:3143_t:CDS:2, partial [Cetraspora pellucida]
KDKKNRTCNRCGHTCATPQMLRVHLNRKNPCRPQIILTTNPIPISQIEPVAEEFKFLKTLNLIEKDAVLDTSIHFIQIRVSDPERPHDNLNLLSNWKAIVPSIKNLRYAFIKPISNHKEYNETPYMPQLLANARDKITRVFKIELNKKEHIKLALVALCYYEKPALEINKDIEEMLRRGSNWQLKLANTKCIINPDNSQTGDDMCLKYAL